MVFDAPGTVSVDVSVVATSGATGTATHSVDVIEGPSGGDPTPPTVSIDGPGLVERGERAEFTAVTDDEGRVVSYEWRDDASGDRATTSVTFGTPTTHTLTVVVEDDDGYTATASHDVSVYPAPDDNRPPTVTVDGPGEVVAGNSAEFVAEADDPDGVVASYDWNVGGVSRRVKTTFEEEGTETVEVTVSDTHGETATDSMQVRVQPRERTDRDDRTRPGS